jgi:eukaryotic-like serine/threonine-protein kinase
MSQGGYPAGPSGPFSGNPPGSDPFAGGAPIPGAPPPMGTPSISPQPRQDANTLATLSVVFAFVFAPVGAILGHLGLAQVRRTGERGRERALVGMTLSYAFITLAVVALVVWAVTGNGPSGSSTAGTSAAPAPTTTAPPPPPTVDAAGMAGLLLSLDEVKAFLGDPNMVSDKTYTDVEPPTPEQGSFDPVDCIGSFAGGVPGPYEGSNYRKYLATTQMDSRSGLQVGQSVAIFHNAAAAQKALANYVEYWRRCGNTQGVWTIPGQVQTGVNLGAPVDAGGGITTLLITFDKLTATFGRAIAAKANVLIDNQVGALEITDQHVGLTQRILERIPG